jgi:hypothetical protein
MKDIAKELELENPLTSEVPGVYVFPLDEEIKIYISTIPQGIYLESTFPYSSPHQEELFTRLLMANLFGEGTNGAALGLAEDGKVVKLTQLIAGTTSYKSFKEALEDFVNIVDFWHEEVLTYK